MSLSSLQLYGLSSKVPTPKVLHFLCNSSFVSSVDSTQYAPTAPSAGKFTINPDTFINFVVEGKAMRPESLSHNTYEKRSWTDINAKCKTEHLEVTWCALCF